MAISFPAPASAAQFEHRPQRPHAVTARFSAPELAALDRQASDLRLNRAQFIRTAVGHFITSFPGS